MVSDHNWIRERQRLQNFIPLVYLLAPALRVRPITDVLLRYLTRDLEVVRVGLAESWRRGLHVGAATLAFAPS